MGERRYLPTFAELLDRLSIVQLKAVFTPYKAQYEGEREDIEHDIDLLIRQGDVSYVLSAYDIRCIMLLMLTNRYIWENEAWVRNGEKRGVAETAARLQLTHAINGVRTQIKNQLAVSPHSRVEHKVDCLAADLPEQFGNWEVL